MMVRHGKVIAEGWWHPYRADLRHTMYSVSKSWTSTAVGLAAQEGLLSVEDKVISFFPDQLPDSVSPYLAQLRLKDLLSMSAGQEPDPTSLVARDTNWVSSFFRVPIQHEPGTLFLYNTLATYMVSAILQKVTGQEVVDYLKPRLFDPLMINSADWETDPQGITVGGWGLRVKTEDMAKLGQLYLQQGKWNGKQLLPEAWIAKATSAVIVDSAPYLPEDQKARSDWAQGYGYQFWRCRNNSYRADGAFGQFIIVMPEQDVVIVMTSETPDMQGELNLVWQYLLPAITSEQLPEDKEAYHALTSRLTSLALKVPQKPDALPDVFNTTYTLEANAKNIESINITRQGTDCIATITIYGKSYVYTFGAGSWNQGETTKPGPYLIPAKNYFAGLPPFQVAGAYSGNEQQLEFTLRYIESPHAERWVVTVNPDAGITFSVYPSNYFGKPEITVQGK
jgi:CubicO group peptidase (beta-lactamase class C family)